MPVQNYYVAGELSQLVLSYMDERNLIARDIRLSLSNYPRGSRMPIAKWWLLLEEIQNLLPESPVGWEIGQQIRDYHSGVLGYLVANTLTVQEALSCFHRYQVLLHNFGPVNVALIDGLVHVQWDYLGKQSTQLSDEVFISSVIAFLHRVTGRQDIHPTRIHFNHPEPDTEQSYPTIFDCDVVFDQSQLGIIFSPDILALPINSSDPHLLEILDRQAKALCLQSYEQDPLLSSLEKAIVESFSKGTPNEERLAKHLNISRRTLHRRLEARGLNYKQFLQQVRKRLADLYMSDQTLSLSDIAFLLGYSEQSAFSRAFKHWNGITPSAYRKQNN